MLSGMMRRLNLVLLASLQLCRARQPGFSIHDDMLAYPQVQKPLVALLLVQARILTTSPIV